jgi:hypothetical protein
VTLMELDTFRVTPAIVKETEISLRAAGKKGYERFALWTGRSVDGVFAVDHLYVPFQESMKLEDGLCVRVDGPALHELNVWLYQQQQTLAVQIHTHPDTAYHSETDDTFPIVTTLGGLSLVIPHFCRDGLMCADNALYRLTTKGWNRLHHRDAQRVLQVV